MSLNIFAAKNTTHVFIEYVNVVVCMYMYMRL